MPQEFFESWELAKLILNRWGTGPGLVFVSFSEGNPESSAPQKAASVEIVRHDLLGIRFGPQLRRGGVQIVDMAAGHGLTAWMLLIMEPICRSAFCIGEKHSMKQLPLPP